MAGAAAALDVLRQAVRLIGAAQLELPTPCRDYDVAALAEHVIGSVSRISSAAGVVVEDPDDDELMHRMVGIARGVLGGWQRRGVDGEVEFAGRALPARALLGIIALEFVVHGWDFAVATDGELSVPDDLATDLLGLALRTLTSGSRRIAGFDEPVAIDADATPLDRLLAFTGRDPVERTRLR